MSDPTPIEVIPPPKPRPLQIAALGFSALAAVAGFLGYCLAAGVLAALSFVSGLVDFLQNRGIVYIPLSAIDSEGRIKGFKPSGGR